MLGVLFNEGKVFMGMMPLSSTHALIITRENKSHDKVTESAQPVTLEELKSLQKVIEDTIFEVESHQDADQLDNS